MKNWILFLLISCGANFCFAQQNFEGHIVYDVRNKTMDSASKFMDVYFKDNKIRINFAKLPDQKDVPLQYIYDFKKGLSYEINLTDSLILTDSLKKDNSIMLFFFDSVSTLTKNILGYNCLLHHYILKKMLRHSSVKEWDAWFSDGLTFFVPDSLRPIQPALLFNEKTFSLSIDMVLNNEEIDMELNNKESVDSVSMYAVLIENKKIDASIFELNRGFVVKSKYQYQKEMSSKFIPPKIVNDQLPKKKKVNKPAKKSN